MHCCRTPMLAQPLLLHRNEAWKSRCPVQVLGGADLFLQGLIVPDEGLGTFSEGDLRAVQIPGNKFPFAVRHQSWADAGLDSGSRGMPAIQHEL